MNISIITEYPSWFIIFCLLAGLAYALLLYRRENLLGEVSSLFKKFLFAFRFITVSLLCFLLLGPMIRSITRDVEKPIIILAVDNSQSIMASKDSVQRRSNINASLEKLQSGLEGKFDLRTLTFGDKIKDGLQLDYSDKQTDFSKLYDEINIQYVNRNVGAIIIASDGLFNAGNSPVSGPAHIKAPLYTIALGDTSEYKDVILSRIDHNKVAYLGNSFPLEVIIDAKQASGSNVVLSLREDSTVLFSRSLNISGNRYHVTVPVYVDAKSRGIKHYHVSVSTINGEVNLKNNDQDVFVEVVESKQKVLLLANAPHPDIAAIRSAIENSPNYEVTVQYAKDFNGNSGGYNLIILHQLPSATVNVTEWEKRWHNDIQSLWFILGAATNINFLNAADAGLNVSSSNGSIAEVQSSLAQDFSLFTISDELKNAIPAYPPLAVPFGMYKLKTNGYDLLTQRIGNVLTGQPLFFFRQETDQKMAVLCGEGLWKWRLADYERSGNSNAFNELISRTVQYLSAEQNKSPFQVRSKSAFMENEPVIFDAELKNESGALINTPELKINIVSSGNKQYNYTFSRTDKAYTLNTGLLPVGNYRYKASTRLGDKVYAQNGEFSVNPLRLETTNTIADHQLMYATASRNGGMMIYPGQENTLLDALKKREDITSVSYQHKKLKELIDTPWIFVIIILFLGLEWFLRKRSGSY